MTARPRPPTCHPPTRINISGSSPNKRPSVPGTEQLTGPNPSFFECEGFGFWRSSFIACFRFSCLPPERGCVVDQPQQCVHAGCFKVISPAPACECAAADPARRGTQPRSAENSPPTDSFFPDPCS